MNLFDIVTDENQETRYHQFVKEGFSVCQGDIYLVKISDVDLGRRGLECELQKRWPDFKFGAIGMRTTQMKLVNDVTEGSRHVLSDFQGIVHARGSDAHALEGPVVIADSRFTLKHPEHAQHSIPEGTYQVLYQRDMAFEEAQRVRD